MKPTSLFPLLATGLILAACHKAPAPAAAPAPKAAPAIVKGATIQAAERTFPRFLRVTGQLAGVSDAIVAANAMGRVATAPVERGTLVKEGDVLATLDERQPRLSLAEAAASLQLAKTRLALAKNEQERNRPLAEKKAVADSDYQKLLTEVTAREAEVAASSARIDLAQKVVDDCLIRAVTGGVVAERMVDPGEYVRADSPVARVVDVATLRLVLNVPETEVGGLEVGQVVEFSTAAFAGQKFTGKVKFLGAALREASRDLVIEAVVDNADGRLRPGFFCDARIQLREEKSSAIPVEAIRVEGSRRRVFLIGKDSLLTERLVEVGETRDGFAEIRKGVTAGESVLARPGTDAADGLHFQPAP